MFQEMQVAGVGGGTNATLLWENPDTSSAPKLAGQTLSIPNLDNFDIILFEMIDETDTGNRGDTYYTGMALTDLTTNRAIGTTLYTGVSYVYSSYRFVQHTAVNELTISTGHFYRAGSSDATSTGYAVYMKIYGMKL